MKKDFLQKSGKELKKMAAQGLNTTKSGVHHYRETKKMAAENQRRWQAAAVRYQDAVSRVSVLIEKTQELLTLCKRYGLTDTDILHPVAQSLEAVFPNCNLQENPTFLWKGAAAGTAVVTSMLGETALFGAASTGTAISGLHGAAAAGATLAHLGGGAVAAGGLGIAGGIAALGTAFAVPAIAAGGYFWDKKVRRQYKQVLAYEEAVDKKCRALRQVYQRYDQLNRALVDWLVCEQKRKQLERSDV